MTFHARLTELLEMEKQGVIGKRDVGKFLVNHAKAIEELVRAAEAAYIAGPENHELADALAKLEKA